MKYNTNEFVHIISERKVKQIVDKEIIEGIEIYYMSDNTSYAEHNLTSPKFFKTEEEFTNFLIGQYLKITFAPHKDYLDKAFDEILHKIY